MNPFELPGPQFLVFFLLFGAFILGLLVWVRRMGEPDPSVSVQLTDPYEIAFLRGGANEVLRLAATGLIDRGILQVDETKLSIADEGRGRVLRNPIERAVLDHFRSEKELRSLFSDGALKEPAALYPAHLSELGLINGTGERLQQWLMCLTAIAVLWLTAIVKIRMGIARHHPFSYLVMLSIAFTVGCFVVGFRRRTQRGERFLADMRTLFEPLRQRSGSFIPRSNNDEVLLMAAVFGVTSLPNSTYPYAHKLFAKSAGSGGDAGCGAGTSCGSSDGGGGSSCGSSGGCGGGGGCGGCGS